MKISFALKWLNKSRPASSSFKHRPAFDLFAEYCERIKKFCPVETGPLHETGTASSKVWICERLAQGKPIDSEALAKQLQKVLDSGSRELKIIIGGPDGISKAEAEKLKPDFLWSFGALTLPHELAAVIAAEQVYRAFSIINRLPYHLGH